MSGPFKMKGFSGYGNSPANKDKDKDEDNNESVASESVASESVQDPTVEQGYQPTENMGVKSFVSVERLRNHNAPEAVIQKEYDKQMKLAKAKAGL